MTAAALAKLSAACMTAAPANRLAACLTEAIDLITPELLARINELARKKRTVGLTAEELAEQKELYKIYLAAIRGQVTNLLESIEFVDGRSGK